MLLRSLLVFMSALTCALHAAGKVDFGPIYVNMRVLQNGRTQERLDMYGARADATLQILPEHQYLCGIVIKPTITFADGKGTFFSTGIGLGQYIPLTDRLSVTPVGGIAYSNLRTKVSYPAFGLFNLRQTTSAAVPYVGIDACYWLSDEWLLSASYQYGWAHTRTTIQGFPASKGRSSGATYSLMLDYYLTATWSVNLAWAYNESLTHELHGTKASGARLGLGYTY